MATTRHSLDQDVCQLLQQKEAFHICASNWIIVVINYHSNKKVGSANYKITNCQQGDEIFLGFFERCSSHFHMKGKQNAHPEIKPDHMEFAIFDLAKNIIFSRARTSQISFCQKTITDPPFRLFSPLCCFSFWPWRKDVHLLMFVQLFVPLHPDALCYRNRVNRFCCKRLCCHFRGIVSARQGQHENGTFCPVQKTNPRLSVRIMILQSWAGRTERSC